MKHRFLLGVAIVLQFHLPLASAQDLAALGTHVNEFGLDLHRQINKIEGAAQKNRVFSPFSIQAALAMTIAGAEGQTKTEMAKTLRFPADEASLHASMAAVFSDFAAVAKSSGTKHPMQLSVANRLFGQEGFAFKAPFLKLTKTTYGAPLEALDFASKNVAAMHRINSWVEDTTNGRIKQLLVKAPSPNTRLVLTNALYFKASWPTAFTELERKQAFFMQGARPKSVQMLTDTSSFRHLPLKSMDIVALPYSVPGVEFLLIVPKRHLTLPVVEAELNATHFQQAKNAQRRRIELTFPSFKLQPPSISLAEALQAMGMKQAFDKPQESANFNRMAPRLPTGYLAISDVVHKAFISVDKNGTEAAAATAVIMGVFGSAPVEAPPLEILVDRPFLFAIQHVKSGACLFLGRVTDPTSD